MSNRLRYEADWEGLRLVAEERPDHWQLFVYDPANYEVLHTAGRRSLEEAKVAAVDFAATHVFGRAHGLKLEVIAAMLVWEPVEF